MISKKLFLVGLLFLTIISFSMVFALDPTGTIKETGKVIGFSINGVEIQDGEKANLKVYNTQVVDLMYYFDYLKPDDVPSGSGLFVIVKDSKAVLFKTLLSTQVAGLDIIMKVEFMQNKKC